MDGYNFAVAAFEGHDLPDKEINLVITSVMNLVIGTARQYLMRGSEDARPSVDEREWWRQREPYPVKAIESGRCPAIARFADETAWDISAHQSMRFAPGLFLDGLAPRMEARRARD